jgi:hypothetical protein
VHNKSFAAAYGGMRAFKPMEIFYQETSLAVIGALPVCSVYLFYWYYSTNTDAARASGDGGAAYLRHHEPEINRQPGQQTRERDGSDEHERVPRRRY